MSVSKTISDSVPENPLGVVLWAIGASTLLASAAFSICVLLGIFRWIDALSAVFGTVAGCAIVAAMIVAFQGPLLRPKDEKK